MARPPVDTTLAKRIAKNIRAARKEAGLSQSQLADKADMWHTAISRYERGVLVPTLGTLAKLAKPLKTTTERLTER